MKINSPVTVSIRQLPADSEVQAFTFRIKNGKFATIYNVHEACADDKPRPIAWDSLRPGNILVAGSRGKIVRGVIDSVVTKRGVATVKLCIAYDVLSATRAYIGITGDPGLTDSWQQLWTVRGDFETIADRTSEVALIAIPEDAIVGVNGRDSTWSEVCKDRKVCDATAIAYSVRAHIEKGSDLPVIPSGWTLNKTTESDRTCYTFKTPEHGEVFLYDYYYDTKSDLVTQRLDALWSAYHKVSPESKLNADFGMTFNVR